jgi:hypothetical protein
MARPALHARVHFGAQPVDVLTCHLKSKLLTFPSGWFDTRDEDERARFAGYALARRTAEAVTVRAATTELLTTGGPDAAVVVLGDLNDVPAAATTQILHGPPARRSAPTGTNARPGRPAAAVEPRRAHPCRAAPQPHAPRPPRAH